MKEKELIEKLAGIEHQRWADWQKYLHQCTHKNEEGEICFNSNTQFEHWERQIKTDYKDLSEEEKESDRDQVRKYLPLLKKF